MRGLLQSLASSISEGTPSLLPKGGGAVSAKETISCHHSNGLFTVLGGSMHPLTLPCSHASLRALFFVD